MHAILGGACEGGYVGMWVYLAVFGLAFEFGFVGGCGRAIERMSVWECLDGFFGVINWVFWL
ncbi:hypothetical protein RchiOBHm_Chr4g0392231 [Rosa chinensis]|uniref:Transmembrane protein n=1 Tax=Rosa chinensis TaxID=74649 RepID=A0A2P6QQN9_ROSCH|nr:hypothetical protein RchiOBHm_Chr4g0392231 [Rosa chinensis]